MNIQTKLARVIEANRISGVKAYGEGEYQGGGVTNVKVQMLMQKSLEASKRLNEIMAKEREGK